MATNAVARSGSARVVLVSAHAHFLGRLCTWRHSASCVVVLCDLATIVLRRLSRRVRVRERFVVVGPWWIDNCLPVVGVRSLARVFALTKAIWLR